MECEGGWAGEEKKKRQQTPLKTAASPANLPQRNPGRRDKPHWGVVARDLAPVIWVLLCRPLGPPGSSATMNLERVSNEEKLNLCRKYYLGGFAFLPFLWLVNIFWFFREAFLAPAYTEQSQIKGYVWRSAVGFLFLVIIHSHHLDHHLPDLPAPLGRSWGLPLLHHSPGHSLTTS